jgi:putative addiction module component (TIGR02574 family)
MQSNANEIFQAALSLSEWERFELASRLMATVPEEKITLSLDDENLEAELNRRSADQSEGIPWSKLRDEA